MRDRNYEYLLTNPTVSDVVSVSTFLLLGGWETSNSLGPFRIQVWAIFEPLNRELIDFKVKVIYLFTLDLYFLFSFRFNDSGIRNIVYPPSTQSVFLELLYKTLHRKKYQEKVWLGPDLTKEWNRSLYPVFTGVESSSRFRFCQTFVDEIIRTVGTRWYILKTDVTTPYCTFRTPLVSGTPVYLHLVLWVIYPSWFRSLHTGVTSERSTEDQQTH